MFRKRVVANCTKVTSLVSFSNLYSKTKRNTSLLANDCSKGR
jgi:hypothetical protein